MRKLLRSARNNIVKEAAWTISNITAGNSGQIQYVIEEGLFEDIAEVLQGGEFRSQKEAAWVITNVTSSGTEQQIAHIIEQPNLFAAYCNLLASKDARCVLVILSGLKNLLALADKRGILEKFQLVCSFVSCLVWKFIVLINAFFFLQSVEQIGAVDLLEQLQNHENNEVYQQAFQIIDTYFSDVSNIRHLIENSFVFW